MLLKLQTPTIVTGLEAFVIVTEFSKVNAGSAALWRKTKEKRKLCAGSCTVEYKV